MCLAAQQGVRRRRQVSGCRVFGIKRRKAFSQIGTADLINPQRLGHAAQAMATEI
jgi:hypothetical protein